MKNVALLLGLLKNNLQTKRQACKLPFSAVAVNLCEKLLEKGYIGAFYFDYITKKKKTKKMILVLLKYDRFGDSFLRGVNITSSPAKRNYVRLSSFSSLDKNKNHLFLTVKGIYWSDEALALGLGGEKLMAID